MVIGMHIYKHQRECWSGTLPTIEQTIPVILPNIRPPSESFILPIQILIMNFWIFILPLGGQVEHSISFPLIRWWNRRYREQKGAGGIIGISTSIGAVQRWILSSPISAGILSSFRSSSKLNQFKSESKDVRKNRIKMDEAAVGRCYNIILRQNAFQKNEKIVDLPSQVEAPLNAVDNLLQTEKIGESCFKEFLKNRIETNSVNFYAAIKKLKLRTFDKRSALTKINRETFTRLLVIQKNRNISLKEVMHSLSFLLHPYLFQTLILQLHLGKQQKPSF